MLRERLRHAAPASGEVAAHFARLRDARKGIGHGFAVDDEHALVARFNFRQKLLRHEAGRAIVADLLDDAAEVQPVGLDAEDAHAAHAVERLEDDVAVFGVKGADGGCRARDQRGRDEWLELHDGEFFRMVAQGAGAVDDQRALALGLLQQVRGVEVFGVKGRVFAHEHGVKVTQRGGARCARCKPRLALFRAGKRNVLHFGTHGLPAAPDDVLRLAGAERVPALHRLAHHGERRVFIGFEGFQRVGNKQ